MRNLLLITALVAWPLVATADSYVELLGGLALPIADDDYEDIADESLKLGVRFGAGAIDGSIDFTPVNTDVGVLGGDLDIQRFRFQVGGRLTRPIGARSQLFGRVSGGLDFVRYSASGQVLGVRFEQSETDLGLAVELAGGLLVNVGKVQIGGQLGIPMAFHVDDGGTDDDPDDEFDYTGVDLDLLFLVSIPL